MKIKVQREWHLIRGELQAALASYVGSAADLSSSSGIDYFSARRYLKNPPENQTKSALDLCSFFKIKVFVQDKSLQEMLDAMLEVWDGTPEHARSLAELLIWSKSLQGTKENQIK